MTTTGAPPLAALRRAARDATPLARVHAATHSRLLEIEPGRCVASMPVIADDPDLGLWVLADFVVGLAVTGTIATGERITTVRLTLQVLRAVSGRELHAVGELVDSGDGVVLSQAVITDDTGRAVARSTGRNAVLRDEAGDTFGDPPPGFAAAPSTAADLLATVADGDDLVGRAGAEAVNSADVVQGGVLAAFATRALGHGLDRRPDEVSATFLRSTPAGEDLHADVTVEHAGRRLRSGRVDVRDAGGGLVLTASGISYAGA